MDQVHTNTYTHTPTHHSYPHAYPHPHTDTNMHMFVHSHACTNAHTNIPTNAHNSHACTHTNRATCQHFVSLTDVFVFALPGTVWNWQDSKWIKNWKDCGRKCSSKIPAFPGRDWWKLSSTWQQVCWMRFEMGTSKVQVTPVTTSTKLLWLLQLVWQAPYVGRDSAVGITTCYGLDGLGIESHLGGARFSAPVQTGRGAHQAPYTMGTRSSPGGGVAGAWRWPTTPFSNETEGRVELYIYSKYIYIFL